MERKQAIGFIKQIFDRCPQLEGKSLKLIPINTHNSLLRTYHIGIESRNDTLLEVCILAVAKEEGLAVKKKDDFVIVYKPDKNKGK